MSHLLSLRQSVINSISYILTNHTNVARSMFFGFSLLGFVGLNGIKTNPQLINTIQRGISFLQNNDYNAFEQTLHVALKMANDLKNTFSITFIYEILASGAYLNKEYEKAKDLFIKVIQQLFDQGGQEDDLKILHISLKLSEIHEILNDYENSEIGYLYCVRHLEEKIKMDPENKDVLGLYAITLETYGRYLLAEGQTMMAAICIKKAYKASVKLNGEVFEMNVTLLNDLGTIYYTQLKFNQALNYFKKAEQIGQNLPAMKSFSMVHINLCYLYIQEGLLKEAEKHLVQGIENAVKHNYDEGKKEAELCYAELYRYVKCKM